MAGARSAVRLAQNAVPERHHAVAHIFVDVAAMLEDNIRHRRQIFVQQRYQFSGWSRSEIEVNPATSEKKTVISRRSPARRRIEGSPRSASSSSPETRWLKNAHEPLLSFFGEKAIDHNRQVAQHDRGERPRRIENDPLFDEEPLDGDDVRHKTKNAHNAPARAGQNRKHEPAEKTEHRDRAIRPAHAGRDAGPDG